VTMRANGEGSVYQRGDGRWVASVLDPQTGKRRSTYASTEKAARKALSGMLTRKDSGRVALDAGATLAVYGRAWVADRAGKRRRESTVREYGWRLEKYVYPVLGGRRLRELTALDVEDMLDTLAARKLSESTLRAVRNALAAMLQDAVRARHLAYNVARSSQLPEDVKQPRPVVAPTDEQVARLIRAAAETELASLLAVLVGTGARIGEALGMTWADLDLDARTWKVARTTTRERNGSVALGKRTKTGASRELVLVPEVVASLRGQRAKVAEAQLRAGRLWVDYDLVFPSSVGTPQDARNLRRDLRPLAAGAGFPGSFHSLRHFYASVALSAVPEASVSKVLGHAKRSTTTDVYGHLRESDASTVAVAVSVAVKRGTAGL